MLSDVLDTGGGARLDRAASHGKAGAGAKGAKGAGNKKDASRDQDQAAVDASRGGADGAPSTRGGEPGAAEQAPSDAPAPPVASNRRSTGGGAARLKDPLTLEAAAVHIVAAGAGWLAVRFIKLFKKQRKTLDAACSQLEEAQRQLETREAHYKKVHEELEQERSMREQHKERSDTLHSQYLSAQKDMSSASERCRAAAAQLERSMSDLTVTETELRASRRQLQMASAELHATTARLEATEGELGLTRSENELLKRELDTLRRQLREAGQQLEGYHLAARSGGIHGLGMGLQGEDSTGRVGDDYAAWE